MTFSEFPHHVKIFRKIIFNFRFFVLIFIKKNNILIFKQHLTHLHIIFGPHQPLHECLWEGGVHLVHVVRVRVDRVVVLIGVVIVVVVMLMMTA